MTLTDGYCIRGGRLRARRDTTQYILPCISRAGIGSSRYGNAVNLSLFYQACTAFDTRSVLGARINGTLILVSPQNKDSGCHTTKTHRSFANDAINMYAHSQTAVTATTALLVYGPNTSTINPGTGQTPAPVLWPQSGSSSIRKRAGN